MNNFSEPYRARRYLAFVSMFGTTLIHKRNPYTIGCWSMAFPGFGHLLLNKYIRGYLLVLWEIFINQKIHLNLAIIYSFNGKFQAARDVLDPRFMSLYIPVYLFAIWDSYRTTVDLNKVQVLAHRENARFSEFTIGALEVNYLDKRKPWISVIWSMGIPSIGQLYLHRIVLATFILLSTIVLVYESRIILAIHYLILGDIGSSAKAVDAQWLLYFPSFYFFSLYDAYVSTVENNKLFDHALRSHLVRSYQPPGVTLTIGSKVD
ncbi:hypothetical protein SAMN05216312_101643 [Cohnella sp. OV330]|uniref:hypothetical protein n=1 Tax=Cohnella sp. OV330 TaxID=1855288 RepID=UPI0008F41602|nr:hypothetical protein [Cohnella sp. OV330]SFA81310.1 hypothetical protein SAMN05216312_101643 [Cohnella sp. OV330]